MPIRALVVDDEQLARDELCYLLESFPDVEVMGQAANGYEAVSATERLRPELLFLDIQMPGLDGFQVVRQLMGRRVAMPRVIFVTAFDQYALQAFEVNAVDYLIKSSSMPQTPLTAIRKTYGLKDNVSMRWSLSLE